MFVLWFKVKHFRKEKRSGANWNRMFIHSFKEFHFEMEKRNWMQLESDIGWEGWFHKGEILQHMMRLDPMDKQMFKMSKGGTPGWLSGWVPAFGPGCDLRIRDLVLHRAPCEEPASPSAYVSASALNLCLLWINKSFKKMKLSMDTEAPSTVWLLCTLLL